MRHLQMKLGAKIGYFVLAWLSIALVGYGLALRKAAHAERVQRAGLPQASTLDPAQKVNREGRISWSDLAPNGVVNGDVHLKLGTDETFTIPYVALDATGKTKEVARYLHAGALVRITARAGDLRVVQYISNFGTAYQKNLLSEEEAFRGENFELVAIETRGLLLAIVGVLLLPLAILLHLGLGRGFRVRTTVSAAPVARIQRAPSSSSAKPRRKGSK